jgi:small subunit ribosomal protein S7
LPRGGRIKKRLLDPDPKYGNRLISRLINRVMKAGKKSVAQKQVYRALDILAEKNNDGDPVELMRKALDHIKPVMEVRSRRVGGAAYQVPMPVKGDRRESLAIRWLVNEARKLPNKEYHSFADKLATEMDSAIRGEGMSVKRRNDTHKAAESNKAFAHFRW